jgi:hypothetical protein
MSLQWAGRLSLFLLLLLVDLDARKAHSEFPVPDVPDFYEGLEEAAWALTKTNVVLNSTNGSISWNSDPGEAISNVARIYLVIPLIPLCLLLPLLTQVLVLAGYDGGSRDTDARQGVLGRILCIFPPLCRATPLCCTRRFCVRTGPLHLVVFPQPYPSRPKT